MVVTRAKNLKSIGTILKYELDDFEKIVSDIEKNFGTITTNQLQDLTIKLRNKMNQLEKDFGLLKQQENDLKIIVNLLASRENFEKNVRNMKGHKTKKTKSTKRR